MKYWQNETLVKSNINCEKYRKNINSYDKAEIFPKKNLKKNNNHAPWCGRCAIVTHQAFLSSLSLQYKILIFNQGCFS